MSEGYYDEECIGCGRSRWTCDLKHFIKDVLGGVAIGFLIGATIAAGLALIHNTFFLGGIQ